MDQQGRLILFITLSMFVLGLWMYLMPTPPSTPDNSSMGVPQALTPVAETSASASEPKSATKSVLSQAKVSQVAVSAITIETDEYIATFSNQGAVLTEFLLKNYLNRQTHQPIELVNADPGRPKPFSLNYSPLSDLNQKIFTVVGDSKKLSKSADKTQLVFRYVDDKGAVLEKAFNFQNGSYLIDFNVTVKQTGSGSLPSSHLEIEWADTLGKEENTGTQSRVQGYRVFTLVGGHVSSESTKKSQESVEVPGPITWTAIANQFFMAALIPDASSGAASAKIMRQFNVYRSPTPENPEPGLDTKVFGPQPLLVFDSPSLRSGESFERKAKVFFGPQDYELLKSLHLDLENAVDFGTFGFISVYMLKLLKWFYTWAHNWGLAIILLSLAVKLALWLPTHNSYKSMNLMQQKMKEIQPKLDAIKRKYADDKQKQQQETMAIYQQAGINPMGGCLPMLLQLPIFWALYATLGTALNCAALPFCGCRI